MKIELSEKEVVEILAQWAESKIPGQKFNEVSFDSTYNNIKGATIEWSEVTAKDGRADA